jgi:hypothetical protein
VQVMSAWKAWGALLVAQFVVIARLGFSMASTAYAVEVYRAMPPLPVQAPEEKPALAAETPTEVPALVPAPEASAVEPPPSPAEPPIAQAE